MVVVKITEVEGEKTGDNKWHYIFNAGGADCTLCTMQVYMIGDCTAVYFTKEGKITCPECITLIKQFKAVKL